jgi:hypothetical protein
MEATLTITVGENRISDFVVLLQSGFRVKSQVGCSVKDFLCGQMGLTAEYYENRILTLFLNSKPVDNPEIVQVLDGATLALSAAMPGLVGATMRRGGHYGRMRGSITHVDDNQTCATETGWITLKLFNLVLKELGPYFLSRGVWLDSKILKDFFKDQAGGLNADIQHVSWNDEEVTPDSMMSITWPGGPVFVRVT